MDDFSLIWKHANDLDNPLNIESSVIQQILKILAFNQFKFHSVTKRFLNVKKISIEPLTTESWAQSYAEIHQHDVTYFGSEHVEALISLLSKPEVCVLINYCIDKAIELLEASIRAYAEVAPIIRLLPSQHKDDLLGFYKFISDAYSTVTHPMLGKFYDSLRSLGNIIAFVWYIDLEFSDIPENKSFLANLMDALKEVLEYNRELFFVDNGLDLATTITHRSFAPLWSVFEFLLCSPKPIQLKQNELVVPLSVFGDSPAVAAHVIITLCNQSSLYIYDSPLYHLLQLSKAEIVKYTDDTLADYILSCQLIQQSRKFAQMLAYPYRLAKK